MSAEEDVQQLEELVRQIEDYLNRGLTNPDQKEDIQTTVSQAEAVFDKIITGYIGNPEKPSFPQAYLVSDLQERLHLAKDSFTSPTVVREHPASGIDKGVTIYTTPTCPWCRKTKNYLSGKEITYLEYNVAQDKGKAKEMVEKSGQMGVPVIVIGDQVIIGFDQSKLAKFLS